LDDLLASMLAKVPDERPASGAAVAEALAALDPGRSAGGAPGSAVALTRTERRTISVVLIGADPGATLDVEPPRERAPEETETLEQRDADLEEALRKGAEAWGGRLSLLRDGSAVVSIGGAGLATDQAAQAARCALRLHRHAGGRPVALSTGRSDGT